MTRPNSKSLRVGILGTGYIAEWHLQALRQIREAQVVALADIDPRRARSMSDAHGIGKYYDSLEAMLSAERLDVLHVLTPPPSHFPAANSALAAGAHVLLEKPMCLEQAQCTALEEQARKAGLVLGVNHNFLFTAEYQQLRMAIARGMVGRIDHVSIVWNKPLGQLVAGPFDSWMLREPQNIILEIGPHAAAHLLDLVGPPDDWRVETDNPVELPDGTRFYRRWRIGTRHGYAAADVFLSFNAGFPEHYVHVRGSHGSAHADFENQTFTLDRPTRYGVDLDRFVRVRGTGRGLRTQSRRNLLQYLLSKLKVSDRGNSFGYSIRQSLSAFYGAIAGQADSRMASKLGSDVVGFCEQLARRVQSMEPASGQQPSPPRSGVNGQPAIHNGYRGMVLVLGGTGFIGKELVRQLVEKQYRVRVLARGAGQPAGVPQHAAVEFVRGSIFCGDALAAAMRGVDQVFHLARAHVKRWEDYYREDVLGAKLVAEISLQAGVKRLLYTGTIDSYYAGRSAGTIREETGLDPQIRRRNYYARAKHEAEELLLAMHRERGLPVVIFRPGIVLGAGGSPFHWGIGMWTGNTVCQSWGDGGNPLPFVLVSDVAAALVAAIDQPSLEGQSFNLVGDPCLSARQYIAELERSLDVKLDFIGTPIWKFYLVDMAKWFVKCVVRHPDRKLPSYRDWESRTQRARFDCTKAKRMLHWKPMTDRERIIREGIVVPAAEFGL